MGVNENQIGNKTNEFNSTKRSETFNETLGPVEEEIKKIAEEISTLREENDIYEKPKEILEKRLNRLNGIMLSNVKEFCKSTEEGKNIYGLIKTSVNGWNLDNFETSNAVSVSDDIIRRYHDAFEGGSNIERTKEWQEFLDRDSRIRKLMDLTDSKLKETIRI
jgi:hypothetical protein